MPRGRKTALVIELTPEERKELEAWQRSSTIRAGLARRGRLILLLADGHPLLHIAQSLGIHRSLVYKWGRRFLKDRLQGLHDKPGRGRKPLFPPGGRRTRG